MTDSQRTYPATPFGLGSEFPDFERPQPYASQITNRFIAQAGGGAEKRRGVTEMTSAPASASFNKIHEIVYADGTAQKLVSGYLVGTSAGTIWKLDTSAENTLTTAYSSANVSAIFRSAQFDDKLLLVNGVDRNVFTRDASAFPELVPLIEQGEAETTTINTSALRDTEIANWITGTDVQINDLIFDATLSAYAVITGVSASAIQHTTISAGGDGLASGGADKGSGDRYEIHDLVELNVVPVMSQDDDNIALLAANSDSTNAEVSGLASARVDFSSTDMKVGDFLRNTTRQQIARVTKVSGTQIQHTEVSGQVAGDSIILLKYAMPIADNVHVHYGRAYFRDARDKRKLRISGPNDPQDMTTDAGTLDSTTFRVGAQESEGDYIVGMASFQQYLVLAGARHTWLFSGTDPIVDTSAATLDFSPTSLFPEGVASPNSVITIGNDGIILTQNGLQSFSLEGSDTLPTREILSNAIRSDIQAAVSGSNLPHPHMIHYPRRNWVLVHGHDSGGAGVIYCFNFAPNLSLGEQQEAEITRPGQRGSWAKFDGKFASMQDYVVDGNNNLLCVDSSGRLFRFDDAGVYDDNGTTYNTTLQTAWLGLDEVRQIGRPTRLQKSGVAILPMVDGSATYTIGATAGFEQESVDSATVSGGSNAVPRVPLRWRGERVRLTFTTSDQNGPDVISGYTVLYNRHGVR